SGSYNSGVFTVTGTPTESGTYTVTTSGGCTDVSATGTVTLSPQPTVTLTSVSGTNSQSVCPGTAITDITYNIANATGATVTGVAGLSGSYNSGVFTVTGTPTESGTYTVTTVGGCTNVSATGTVTLRSQPTVTLTSATGTNSQSVCPGTAIGPITYNIANATGAIVTGVPGLSGTYSNGAYTITGTPTASGTYTVTTSGGCTDVSATGTVTLRPQPTVTLASASGTNSQSVCPGTTVTPIRYNISGALGATVTGVAGLSGSYNSGVFTVTGTPTESGTYTVTTSGGCTDLSATGTVTLRSQPTVTLTSASGSNSQSMCPGTAISAITYNIANATGGVVTGVAGLNGSYNSGVFTVTGTPTESGTYTVTTSGGCNNVTATGTITVLPAPSITLTSINNQNQSVCRNVAISNITFAVGGSATGASVTGLPTGVTGTFNAGVLTISGTPNVSGTYNYTVDTSGDCDVLTTNGTIIVRSDPTIGLTSTNNNIQTVCRNNPISNITYAIGGSATSGTVVGLPEGLTFGFNEGILTISGSPTAAGTFNYTASATGTCVAAVADGTITVRPDATISLTSGNNNNQTLCINGAIEPIAYVIGGSATNGSVIGLPEGISYEYNDDTDLLTISGTPTVSGVFNYTASATDSDPCPFASINGTLTVTADATLTLTTDNSNQGVCINEAISPIRITVGGSGTGGTVSGLPSGVNWTYNSGVITISGTPSVSGNFNFTVRASGSCIQETEIGTIRVTSDPAITLSSSSRNQTVCLNSPLTPITFNVGGSGSGGTVTGLPAGLTGEYRNSILTIEGTPTETGTFNYVAMATSSCGNVQTAGIISVRPNATIDLTSNNSMQTVCVNNSIDAIRYSISGNVTGGSVKGLPTGVSGTYNNNVITINGTPSQSGVFEYTVVTVGICSEVVATGTITVNANAIVTLTSSNNDQTVCINTPVENIVFQLDGSTENATVSGLPDGVYGTIVEPNLVISGSPTVSGIFNYTVNPVGSCNAQSASGTLIVNPDATISLTTSNDNQTVCIGSGIADIVYTIDGSVTNATVIGLPTGVNGVFENGNLTISGIPISAGTFDFTATASGPCANSIATGTITVNTLPTAQISGTATVCYSDNNPTVVFTGALGTAPYTFTYTINSGAEQTITSSNGNTASISVSTDQEGVYTYSLLRVEDSSPSSCGQSQSGSATVVVNSLPTATIIGTTQVCEGSESPEVIFRGDNGTAPYTFFYSINGGETLSVSTTSGEETSVDVPTDVVGELVYELLSVRDASASQCERSQTGTATITINSLPQAEISGTTTVCLNEAPPEIMFTGSEGTAPYTFNYSINGGDVSSVTTVQGNSVSVLAPTAGLGVFEYNLISVQDNGGSISCENNVVGTASVTVQDLPLASITGTASVCRGDTPPKITLTGSNGVAPYTFTYTINGGSVQVITTQEGNSVAIDVPTDNAGDYLYELVSVSEAGNNSCFNQQEGSALVSVFEIPQANAGLGGNNCGLRYILNATPSYGSGAWTMSSGPGNAVFTPDANSPDAQVSVDEFGMYEFTWTEENGPCSDMASIEVNFLEGTSAFAGDDFSVCGFEANLNADSDAGAGTWRLLDGPAEVVFSPNAQDPNAEVNVSETGSYQFEWTIINHVCESHDIVEVVFNEIPTINAGQDTVVCFGYGVQLQAIGDGTFVWEPASSLDDANISNPIATPLKETIYRVTLTDDFGCTNYDEVIVDAWQQPIAEVGEDMELEYIFEFQLEASELKDHEVGKWQVIEGTGVFSDDTAPVNIVSGLSIGTNILSYTVSNEVCPISQDYLVLKIKDLVIPTLITPNFDGKNEKFIIRGIETLGKTELIIFDRRGLQVYKNSQYDNSWNGVDQSGNPLPDDTYYFSLKPTFGKAHSGYIVIRR
ncbi:gliding motility-associated C-terminal domain-containing protein, partial [Saccharicrinis sp. 156]|uniref:T9SS type B sorting domain-containing protein n=1 Tax=Saccharicrinis sp. 156 TaxID=3417574 RepID=UPI003D34E52B